LSCVILIALGGSVQDKTFITAMAEYQFLFKSGSDAQDRYDDGVFLYSIGIGFNY